MSRDNKTDRPAKPTAKKPADAARTASRRRWLLGAGAVALGGAGVYVAATTFQPTAPVYTYRIVRRYPHDEQAFTQGLVYFRNNILYEGTGLERRSSLREVDLETGHVRHDITLPDPTMFGEGITLWEDKIYQLTWQNHVVFVYDRATFRLLRQFENRREGWGLTHDGRHLIMSGGESGSDNGDGSNLLTFHDPDDFREVRSIRVFDGQAVISKLNELEYIDGEIYANVWHQSRIARIDPQTGQVRAWLDLTGLRPNPRPLEPEAVLNGIAYDAENQRLFVTGKLWSELFEIRQVAK